MFDKYILPLQRFSALQKGVGYFEKIVTNYISWRKRFTPKKKQNKRP